MTAFSRISLAAALLSGLALPALAQTQPPAAAAPATTVASTPAKTPKLHNSVHHAAATTTQPGDVKASDSKTDAKPATPVTKTN